MSDSTAIVNGGDNNSSKRNTVEDVSKIVEQSKESSFSKENIPKSIPITLLGQCQETNSFKSNFTSWSSASTAPVPEETRGKVAALLKQQQGLIKGQAKTPPVEEEVPPLLAKNGKLEMWRIDGEEKTRIDGEEKTPLPKEDHYLCCWFGKDRSQLLLKL
ncbi:hypothetical protein L2E82_17112 [Cichorium intybus]|uniref:Uncharacterized protein n=1 Tax=Cichorium intybus TaxID=13427 RepID=A0ACB9F7U9_CICIN|nr:hypothetical protein L2E82_17112 [Cichorium intybus]